MKTDEKMKRTVLFLAAAILMGFGLQSCDKEDDNGGNNVVNNGDNNGGGDNGGNNGGGDNGGDNGGGNGGTTTTTVQWVDLGLPSGLLWADRNVGANKPEDYGIYYAWGETAPKEVYDWDTYLYGFYRFTGIQSYHLTKYCTKSDYGLNGFTDNLTTLEASDDAATVNLGGNARMPRDYECQELMDNTTVTWTTRNGVFGRKFTASNGKSIFLPAAGFREGSTLEFVGEDGHYWSSNLNLDSPSDAWVFYFDSCRQSLNHGASRSDGFSVRAVRAK